jgi:hypothetical protein
MHNCLRNNCAQCTTVSLTGVHLMRACISLPHAHMRGCVKHNHTLCVGKGIIPVHMHVGIPPSPMHWWAPTQNYPCTTIRTPPN